MAIAIDAVAVDFEHDHDHDEEESRVICLQIVYNLNAVSCCDFGFFKNPSFLFLECQISGLSPC